MATVARLGLGVQAAPAPRGAAARPGAGVTLRNAIHPTAMVRAVKGLPLRGAPCLAAGRRAPATPRSAEAEATTTTASPDVIKEQLLAELEGLNRGIFGVKAAEKEEIHRLIEALETHNPTPKPTADLGYVAGDWVLLYSTIKIMGSKRTKLGLREFVKLGEFVQSIDVESKTAVNEITFAVSGLGQIKGAMTVTAGYEVASDTRVDIEFRESTLVPEGLLKIFQKNYDLLLGIFNPEGWLEITYVDDSWRVGRDDKGNVYLLRRAEGVGEAEEAAAVAEGAGETGGDDEHLQ